MFLWDAARVGVRFNGFVFTPMRALLRPAPLIALAGFSVAVFSGFNLVRPGNTLLANALTWSGAVIGALFTLISAYRQEQLTEEERLDRVTEPVSSCVSSVAVQQVS
jgi:hypothetical protein